jgi:hypothetical protein
MKNLLYKHLLITACFLGVVTTNAIGQNWLSFENLSSQLDNNRRAEYNRCLAKLCAEWNPYSYNLSRVLDSLSQAASGSNPAAGIGDVMGDITAGGREQLTGVLAGSGLTVADSGSVVTRYDAVTAAFAANQTGLSQAFGQNQSAFGFNRRSLPNSVAGVHYLVQKTAFDSLTGNQKKAFDLFPGQGINNVGAALDQLFSASRFAMLELNFGRQFSDVTYYGQNTNYSIPVMGIRSVEQFNSAWESRWRMQGSWIPGNKASGDAAAQKASPLMFNGSFEVMYSQGIGRFLSRAPVRVVTLLGIEASTYAPAHKTANNPNNLGNTTGWGPSLGAGFASTVGNTTIYAIGVQSLGKVVCRINGEIITSPYLYRSTRLEAGVKVANTVTLRYELGLKNSWADKNDKILNYHQVTVGIGTASLLK